MIRISSLLAFSMFFGPACYGQRLAEEQLHKRIEYMRDVVRSFVITPVNVESELPTRFREDALLRFGDPTRGASDGSLWKLGAGRPEAIVAMEFTDAGDRYTLNYEFLSLTKSQFELATTQGWKWSPSGSAIEFKKLDGRQSPGQTSSARLRQMKMLARRFTASEEYNGERYRLRLLPQPIDIYVIDKKDRNGEGAIFVFANGTNPEVLLLLEAIDGEWHYGLARLCGAAPTVKLDESTVWTKPSMEDVGKSWRLDYTGEAHAVDLSLLGSVQATESDE